MKFSVGFGTEFALLAKNGGLVSTEARELQCGPVNNCVHEMAQCVVGAGIKLETYHVGSVGGQVCLWFHLPTLECSMPECSI